MIPILALDLGGTALPPPLVEAVAQLVVVAPRDPPQLSARGDSLARGTIVEPWAPAPPATPPERDPGSIGAAVRAAFPVCFGPPTTTPVLETAIEQRLLPIRHCWQHALDHGVPDAGVLVARLTFAPSGALVASERDERSTFTDDAVAACVFDVLDDLTLFHRGEGWLVVRYPFRFGVR
ncbi:MAG: hypothetical protein H6735_19890 [Alphaproteobacteria bacterium]|nr:hypothetical protein [Alphaproteobacteria bacterium]